MAALKPSTVAPINAAHMAHGFSGQTVTVEFLKTKDNEPVDIFVGVNEYQARIKRGVPVTIPVEVFEVLKTATYTDKDNTDPDNPEQFEWVEKQRYPYNVLSRSE